MVFTVTGNSAEMPSIPYKAIIFDIGDVLFTWSSQTSTKVSAQTMAAIISHPVWFEFERGRISSDQCYFHLGQEFSIEASEVSEAFEQARNSLKQDNTMITFIRQLKHAYKASCSGEDKESVSPLAIYAMSNISKPDYDYLRAIDAPWELFDQIFASGYANMRKPDACFFDYVLKEIGRSGEEVVFVDDKLENIESAQALGLYGVQFKSASDTVEQLKKIFGLE